MWVKGQPIRGVTTLPVVELVPKLMIVGVLVQPPVPGIVGTAKIDREALNRIWSEVNLTFQYQSLQMSPAGDAAVFVGASPESQVAIQPPIVQVRDAGLGTFAVAADQAQSILKIVARNVGSPPLFNLGIRLVLHAPVEQARAFVLRVLKKDEQEFDALRQGGEIWASVKYVVNHPDGVGYTLTLEPLVVDDKFLLVDLDAQFQGPVQLDLIRDRAKEVETYVSKTVRAYLETFLV